MQGDLVNLIQLPDLRDYLSEPIAVRTISETLLKGLESPGGAVGYTRGVLNKTPSIGELLRNRSNGRRTTCSEP